MLPFQRLLGPAILLTLVALGGCVSMHGENTGLAPASDAMMRSKAEAQQQTLYTSAPISLVQFNSLDARGKSRKNVGRRQIPAGTPGLVIGSGEGWLAVRFDDSGYLYFTKVEDRLDGSRLHDERISGRYYLYLPDWDGRAGSVSLRDNKWLAVGESRGAYLLNSRDARPEQTARSTSLCSQWLDEKR